MRNILRLFVQFVDTYMQHIWSKPNVQYLSSCDKLQTKSFKLQFANAKT